MTANRRRAISWAAGIVVGGGIFLLFLHAPAPLDADGTVESRGTGTALTLLVSIAAVYLITLGLLEWRYRGRKPAQDADKG